MEDFFQDITPVKGIQDIIHQRLLGVHTAIPGNIVSFDEEKMTAVVQPGISKITKDGKQITVAPCVDVPVLFPGSGSFFMTFPVSAGDGCLLIFSERCIDAWWSEGGVQAPQSFRSYDMSDAVAILGLMNQKTKIDGVSQKNLEIRDRDGKYKICILDDGSIETHGTNFRYFDKNKKIVISSDENNNITIDAQNISFKGSVRMDGDVHITGECNVGGDVKATDLKIKSGIVFSEHTHAGVESGGSKTLPPS